MKGALIIVKKELKRIFQSRSLVFSTFILPILIIVAIYAFMGQMINSAASSADQTVVSATIVVDNLPTNFKTILDGDKRIEITYEDLGNNVVDDLKKQIGEKYDAILIFEENFEDKLESYSVPNIDFIFSSESTSFTSVPISNIILEDLAVYKSVMQEELIGAGSSTFFKITQDDISPNNSMNTMLLSMLLPMLIIMYVFQGVMQLAPESISGEKERNTLATLLVTPIKRSHIVFGKVIGTVILSVIMALCSFVGILISLPLLYSGMSISFPISTYILILLSILSLTLLVTTILLVISTFAKNIKEATAMSAPLLIISMVIPFLSVFSSSSLNSLSLYFVPFLNISNTLVSLVTSEINVLPLAITFISNLVYSIAFIFILTKMFKSEKIMFRT